MPSSKPQPTNLVDHAPDFAHEEHEHVHGPDCSHPHEHVMVATYRREAPKLGRNDPCHCGSGKKFKKCHGMAT